MAKLIQVKAGCSWVDPNEVVQVTAALKTTDARLRDVPDRVLVHVREVGTITLNCKSADEANELRDRIATDINNAR